MAEASAMREATVQRFLDDYGETRVAVLAKIGYVCGLPIGPMHLIDVETGQCATCADPPEAHWPLTPEDD